LLITSKIRYNMSIGQSELDMKIDKLKNSKLEKNEENINSM